ncbi:putative enzyme related to lactoylglutathione lyase [Kitasatospora sp. MAA4]|uniref:VOC family protein n=1 Tax=Kitasatospora sp. MAA4 TaxID=3035093 RepID=UPI0024733DF1|nr:VOC family protein [Kitasatospora sp. MAA4]MDH6133945.1 putative enzyme related to lactoylglutathione lyase [Kitasatospora sp. MAA4]
MTEKSSTPTGFASLAMVTIDCADPVVLAGFYSELLGWEIGHSQAEYAMITNPLEGGAPIGFGQVAGYQPAPWPNPNGSKQFHLDFYVDDLAKAATRAVELGATFPEFQPGETWRVLIDPAGHPFCLCIKS